MKWSITQLRKYQGQPFKFNQTVTFNHLIQNLDLLDLSPIDIEGELIVKSNEVVATMHLTGQYKMACARTLVPVDVPLDATTTEVFDLDGLYEDEDDEHYHLVTNGMIDFVKLPKRLLCLRNQCVSLRMTAIKCLLVVKVGKLLTKIIWITTHLKMNHM